MDKKRIIITGGSDGIGAAAAKKLVALGHEVVIVGRDPEKTRSLAEKLGVTFHTADYSELKQVVKLSEELKEYGKIDVLANNAGGVMNRRTVTSDGFEKTFQVNLLAQFLLVNRLIAQLIESNATVIQTTSIAANAFSDFAVEDLNSEQNYKAFTAYGNAKLGDVLFTRELNDRFKGKIYPVAFEPGVVRTNFGAEGNAFVRFCYHTPLKYLFTISPEKSADRLVRLALGTPGKDFSCGETYSFERKYAVKFRDENGDTAKKLWEYCYSAIKDYL